METVIDSKTEHPQNESIEYHYRAIRLEMLDRVELEKR